MGLVVGQELKGVQSDVNTLFDFKNGRGWFIEKKHKEAAYIVLLALLELESKYTDLKAMVKQKEADFKKIPEWKNEVEGTKRELAKAISARRGLERENTRMEKELAELKSKKDDGERATVQQLRKELEKVRQEAELNRQYADKQMADQASTIKSLKEQCEHHCKETEAAQKEVGELTNRNANERTVVNELKTKLEASNKAKNELLSLINDLNAEIRDKDAFANSLRADLTISRGLVVRVANERDQAVERLQAIALNATQIKLIVERDLEIINGHAEVPQEKEPIPTEPYRREPFMD